VQTFEDVISRDVPESLFQSSLKLFSILPEIGTAALRLYRSDLVIKDTLSENLGYSTPGDARSRFEDDKWMPVL